MPHYRLPRIIRKIEPERRKKPERPLNRFIDVRDRNGSTSGPAVCQLGDDVDLPYFLTYLLTYVLTYLLTYSFLRS